MKRIAILISGRGSNMEALLGAGLPAEICAVVSNNPAARGLATASARGIATAAVDHRAHSSREAFDAALAAALDACRPDLVVLAGFMRILTPAFVGRYAGRMVNIHPSLLPSFPGLHTHRQALSAGVRIHGCTVHFVTAQVDAGPIIAQAAVPVFPEDGEEALAARVLKAEHRLYPAALALLAEGKVRMEGGRTVYASFPVKGGPAETILSPDPVSANSDIEALARFTP
ncbi:MAG: phosphoribosylglycinamide formyltransferase [Burkholderiales bacterium]|nr:phosphoribosylglycinamide formyltransferase [Burkholderiales bacterium]